MSDCKCKQPCSPCNNNCPDDGEIIESTILDPEDCNTNCCWKKCSDNCWINIQSTNDCLVVDTSECWVIKLTAECPKPTYVKAWNNVTVKDVTPPDDCYIDGGDCDVKGWREISSTDEKVKACSWDKDPWFLDEKLVGDKWITVEKVNCDSWVWSKLKLNFNENQLPACEHPDVVVHNSSKIINTSYSWHDIRISDKEPTTYNNNVCIGFISDKDIEIEFNESLNAKTIEWVDEHDSGRTVCTWNTDMATHQWVKILESGYYRVFWQLTVQNNLRVYPTAAEDYFINLWRAFLKLTRSWAPKPYLLGTAKHWAYWRQVLLTWGNWISISADWEISFTWASGSWNAPEGWWTVSINVSSNTRGGTQPNTMFDWPWMTYNIDCYVDLYKDDILTLWYRCQSNMGASAWKKWHFRFTWATDPSTEFDYRLFGGTSLWVQFIAPKLFQAGTVNKFFSPITQ